MKELTLRIKIARTPEDVFEFTTNPANTPKWIDFITEEQTNEWPPKVGTIYRNHSGDGQWSELEVTSYAENYTFTMSRKDGSFHVTYTVKPLGENLTELEFHERVEEGELGDQFTQATLEKLKRVMEAT
ncbi:MAG: hypothetical protein JWN01_530 [Patescibacteria group bacterium]|nr:hypothetical protein [Patescibacteria group bacterium]